MQIWCIGPVWPPGDDGSSSELKLTVTCEKIPGDLRQSPLDALQRLLHERRVLQEEKGSQKSTNSQPLNKEGSSVQAVLRGPMRQNLVSGGRRKPPP